MGLGRIASRYPRIADVNLRLAAASRLKPNQLYLQRLFGKHQRLFRIVKGLARTQIPTTRNCAPELPTFGAIADFSQTGVQWEGLDLEDPPS